MKTSWCGMGRPGEKLGSSVRVGFPLGDPGSLERHTIGP